MRLFNGVLYNLMVAERFSEFAMQVQERQHLRPESVVVVAGEEVDHILLHRVCQHLLNREVEVVVYCPPALPGRMLSQVKVVQRPGGLPAQPPLVYLLNAQVFHQDEEFRRWLMKVAKTPPVPARQRHQSNGTVTRVVGLEFRVFELQSMHSLYLGACDESVSVRAASLSQSSGLRLEPAPPLQPEAALRVCRGRPRHPVRLDRVGGGDACRRLPLLLLHSVGLRAVTFYF